MKVTRSLLNKIRPARLFVLLALISNQSVFSITLAQTSTATAGIAQGGLAAKFRSVPICKDVGQQVKLQLHTGAVGATPPMADPFWRIVSPAAVTPFTTAPVGAPGLWLPNSSTEQWIQPSAAGSPGTFPAATYVYSTQFVTPVDPYFYSSITVSGDVAADDGFVVKLNGIQLGVCSAGSTSTTWCFHSWKAITQAVDWHAFTRTGNFLNTLTIEVKNTGASPSGLIVRAQVIATCSKCTTPLPKPAQPCGGTTSPC
jgi:hypothetical protein